MVSTAPISMLLEGLLPTILLKTNPNPNITRTHHSQKLKGIPGKDYKLIYKLKHSGTDQRTKFYMCS